jgi:hypothetical protein
LIDLGTNTGFPTQNPLPLPNAAAIADNGTPNYMDILFSPSGAVISPGVTTSTINLWVRSPADDQPTNVFRGDPTIVAVFVRTGLVGAFPPDQNTANATYPYTYVK